jgi:molybdopterin synthase catalytic subunit
VKVEAHLFAAYREAAGWSRREMEVEAGSTAATLWESIREACPALAARRPLCAVNRTHAGLDRELEPGDEVAFFPPVSGGAEEAPAWSDPAALVVEGPLDLERLEALVRSDRCGALCTFVGVVRDHHEGRAVEAVTYEAYGEMAGLELARLCREAEQRWPGVRALAVHRTGRLEVGEASVACLAAAPHRAEAFEACRHLIEGIKEKVPVWKQDHFTGGESSWRD